MVMGSVVAGVRPGAVGSASMRARDRDLRTMLHPVVAAGLSVLVLAGAAHPARSQEASTEPPAREPGASAWPAQTQVPVASTSGRPDLYLDMPYFLGGFEPQIVMTRGREHFANVGDDGRAREQLEGLLHAVGAEVEDMTSGYALVSQEGFFSFVVAIRIEGVEPGTLLPAYLPLLYQDLEDPQGISGRISGKDVIIVASLGNDDEYVELYVYDEGDTVWMVQGPVDVVETTLANLPGPLPPA
jgi:hypothetical protein